MAATDRRPRRSRAQWQALIEQAERSGLSARAFCQGEGINLASFYQWRKRLAAEGSESHAASDTPASDTFIDLGPLGDGRSRGGGDWDIELQLGADVVLRLRRG